MVTSLLQLNLTQIMADYKHLVLFNDTHTHTHTHIHPLKRFYVSDCCRIILKNFDLNWVFLIQLSQFQPASVLLKMHLWASGCQMKYLKYLGKFGPKLLSRI